VESRRVSVYARGNDIWAPLDESENRLCCSQLSTDRFADEANSEKSIEALPLACQAWASVSNLVFRLFSLIID